MAHFGPSTPGEARTSFTTQQPDGVPLRVLTLPVEAGGKTYIVQLAYPLDDF